MEVHTPHPCTLVIWREFCNTTSKHATIFILPYTARRVLGSSKTVKSRLLEPIFWLKFERAQISQLLLLTLRPKLDFGRILNISGTVEKSEHAKVLTIALTHHINRRTKLKEIIFFNVDKQDCLFIFSNAFNRLVDNH